MKYLRGQKNGELLIKESEFYNVPSQDLEVGNKIHGA